MVWASPYGGTSLINSSQKDARSQNVGLMKMEVFLSSWSLGHAVFCWSWLAGPERARSLSRLGLMNK